MQKLSLPAGVTRALALLLLLSVDACVTEQEGLDLFPLYRNVGDSDAGEFSLLFPLSRFKWDADETTTWTIPFFIHWTRGEHEQITLLPCFPIYFHQRDVRKDTEGVLPLYSRQIEGSRTDWTLLLLLADWAYYENEPGLTSLSVFPLFQWVKGGTGSRFSLVRGLELSPTGPIISLFDYDRTGLRFGDGEDEQALSIDVGGLFGRLVNLFHYDDVGSHTNLRVMTLFANENWSLFYRRTPHEGAPGADSSRTVLFPFYWDVQHDADTRTRVIWPFYGRTRRGDHTVNRFILFPLLWLVDDEVKEESGFRFLWPLAGYHRKPHETHTWLHPLFHYAGLEDGYEWSMIFSMFGFGRKGDTNRIKLFWFPWEF